MFKAEHVIGALLAVILLLACILIFRKPKTVVEEFDKTPYLEQIEIERKKAEFWEAKATKMQTIADGALKLSDSLQNIKPTIKHVYHEIYKFNSTATTTQLDSVIRSNW